MVSEALFSLAIFCAFPHSDGEVHGDLVKFYGGMIPACRLTEFIAFHDISQYIESRD